MHDVVFPFEFFFEIQSLAQAVRCEGTDPATDAKPIRHEDNSAPFSAGFKTFTRAEL